MREQQPPFTDRGFYLGPVFRRAADRHGAVFVTLDRPLDTHPALGVDLTYPALAEAVEDLSGRLWEAGVRPSARCPCCSPRGWPVRWSGS
jgi:hypothetical protein